MTVIETIIEFKNIVQKKKLFLNTSQDLSKPPENKGQPEQFLIKSTDDSLLAKDLK